MKLRALVVGLALLGGTASQVRAADGKISGYMFGDYYYNVSGPAEKQNGFQFRRVYFTYDLKWSDQVSGRFRLEANDARFSKSTGKMTPYVKESSITWKRAQGSLSAGMVPTLTWALQEKVWGYRSIEKTIMDLRGKGAAVDLGLQWTRKLGGSSVALMVSNGNGTSAETDNDKKFALQGVTKVAGLDAKVYADVETPEKGKGKTTLAGFIGKSGDGFHGGAEAFYRIDKKAADGEDMKGFGVSLFGAKPVAEGKKVFARVDLYEPNGDAEDDQETLLIAGLDWSLAKDLHLMPNLMVTLYQDSAKDTQVVPRLTGFFEF